MGTHVRTILCFNSVFTSLYQGNSASGQRQSITETELFTCTYTGRNEAARNTDRVDRGHQQPTQGRKQRLYQQAARTMTRMHTQESAAAVASVQLSTFERVGHSWEKQAFKEGKKAFREHADAYKINDTRCRN